MIPRDSSWSYTLERRAKSWKVYQLGELFSQRKERGCNELPLLSVTGKHGVVEQDSLVRRDTSNSDKSKYLRVIPDDIVYNTMRMWQGVSAKVIKEGIVSPAYTVCVPKTSLIFSDYAKFLFKYPALIRKFHAFSQGLVDDTLNLKFPNFAPIKVSLPPLPEQKRIAEILTSVDDAIQATEKVISQTKRVKQGLLQELFTRGIRHSKFKKTEIGEIPEGWVETELGNKLHKVIGGGTPSKKIPNYWDGDVYWASVKDIRSKYLSNTIDKISQEGLKNSSANLIPANTIVVPTRMALGKASITDFDMAINQDLKALIPKKDLDFLFLYYWYINSSKLIESLGSGSTVKGIRLETLKRLKLLLPPLPEQKRIAEILTSLDDGIQAAEKAISQTKRVKQGLLQDLLTGRVRTSGVP